MGFFDQLSKGLDSLYDATMKYGDTSKMSAEDIERATRARNNHKYCDECGARFHIDLDDEYDCQRTLCIPCQRKLEEIEERERIEKQKQNEILKQKQIEDEINIIKKRRNQEFLHDDEGYYIEELENCDGLPSELKSFYNRLSSNPFVEEILNFIYDYNSDDNELESIVITVSGVYFIDSSDEEKYQLIEKYQKYNFPNLSLTQVHLMALYLKNNVKCFNCTGLGSFDIATRLEFPNATDELLEILNYSIVFDFEPLTEIEDYEDMTDELKDYYNSLNSNPLVKKILDKISDLKNTYTCLDTIYICYNEITYELKNEDEYSISNFEEDNFPNLTCEQAQALAVYLKNNIKCYNFELPWHAYFSNDDNDYCVYLGVDSSGNVW